MARVLRTLAGSVVLGLVAGVLTIAPASSPAAATDGASSPAGAPVICDGDTLDNWGTASVFGRVYVPAGATVRFTASGEILPSRYVGSGRGEYTMWWRVSDGGVPIAENYGFDATGIVSGPEPYPWQPFSGAWLRDWYNNTGTSKVFDIETWAQRSYAGAGIHYSVHMSIPGGSGYNGLECQKLENDEVDTPNRSMPNSCDAQPATADPVNVVQGNLWQMWSDAVVAGRGPGLSMTRTYSSSRAATNGPLGQGWSFSYGMSLAAASGMATIRQENGAVVRFVEEPAGQWTAPHRVNATLATDPGSTTARWTFVRGGTEVFTFDSSGKLTSIADLSGNQTTLGYSGGVLSTITEPSGRVLTLTWAGGKLASVAAPPVVLEAGGVPAEMQVSYGYTGDDLTEVTQLDGGIWTYTYDAAHRLTKVRAPEHHALGASAPVVETHYDAQGRVDWQEDRLDERTTFDWGTADQTTVTDPAGQVVVYEHTDGVCTGIVRNPGANQSRWIFEVDAATLGRTKTTDPNGSISTAVYNDRGLRTSIITPRGTTETVYDPVTMMPTSVTDPMGTATTYTYAPGTDRLTGVSRPVSPGGGTWSMSLDYTDPANPGRPTAVVDAMGKTWSYAYNEQGDLVSTTDPTGRETTSTHNSHGWPLATVAPAGNAPGGAAAEHTTTFAYDLMGRVTRERDPLWDPAAPTEHQVLHVYDANGNLESTTDGNNGVTVVDYDPADRPVLVHRPDATTVGTQYWPNGQLQAQIDGAGRATTYSYDPQGRLDTRVDPLGRATTYGYDPAGNVITKQDPGGDCAASVNVGCTTMTYDAADQLTGIDYSDAATPDVTAIGYDSNGRRESMVDGTGTSTWSWDSLGRLLTSATPTGGTVGYGYNLRGNTTSITYPAGVGTVTRGFDDAGRLQSVTDWLGHTSTFEVDDNANPLSASYGNGTSTDWSIDAANQVMAITHKKTAGPFASFQYERDGNGQATQVTSSGVPADNHTYEYNPLSFLTDVDDNSATAHGYDPADNLTRLADGTLQQFDVANQLTESSRISFVGTTAEDVLPVATTVTVGLPAGWRPGDLALVAAVTSADSNPPTIPGYSYVHTVANQGDSAAPRLDLYRRLLQAGDSSVTASYPNQITASKALQVVVYRGVDPTNPVSLVPGDVITSGTQVPVYAASGATAGQQRVVFEASYSNAIGAVWSASAPLVQRFPQTSNSALISTAVADHLVAADGHAPAATVTSSQVAQLLATSLLLRPETSAYTYSPQGSRSSVATGSATMTYEYDQAQRLTQFASGSTSAVYAYRGDGQRASKSVDTGAGVATTNFTWDESAGLPLLLAETTGGKQVNYIYGPGGRVLQQIAARPTPTRVGAASAVDPAGAASSLTVNFPPVAPRDQIILVTTANQSVEQGVPAGYTTLITFGDPSDGVTIVARRTAVGGETSATVTYGNGSLQNKSVGVVIYRGVDPENPIVTVGSPDSTPSQLTSPTLVTAPSVTAAEPGEQLIVVTGVSSVSGGDGKWLPPGEMALAVGTSTGLVDHGLMIADQSLIAPGPTGSRTTQYFSTLSGLGSVALTLRPAPAPAFYYHADQLGSIRSVTDEYGNIAATATYDPYGHTAAQTTAPGTNLTNPFGFAGEYRDAESGLTYLRARYYDPATGQFLARDPIEPATRSAYGYVGNNPLNFVDPSGLVGIPISIHLPSPTDFLGGLVDRVKCGFNWLQDVATDGINYVNDVASDGITWLRDNRDRIIGVVTDMASLLEGCLAASAAGLPFIYVSAAAGPGGSLVAWGALCVGGAAVAALDPNPPGMGW